MIINNKNIESYNAQVSSKLIQRRDITITSDNVKDSYFLLNEEEGMKTISIRILFKANSRKQVYNNISNFLINFRNEATIKFNNIDNYFNVFLVEQNTEETEFEDWLYLNLTVKGYEYGNLISTSFSNKTSFSINNPGNLNSPCIVEIKPTVIDLADLKITGLADEEIIIETLRKNQTIVINSLDGSVKVNNTNKYGDTDMWEFPRLKPGQNNISISRNNCDISIRYNPRFL